ncbi:MAG: hypothetical protein Kow00127_08880 [Bacteroidales bacterium]
MVVCITVMLLPDPGFAQPAPEEERIPIADRLILGGGLGLSFGNYSTLVDISPIIGYAFAPTAAGGIGLTYKYYRYKDYFLNTDDGSLLDLENNYYGWSVWLRYFLTKTEIPVIQNGFLHFEVEPLRFVNSVSSSPAGNILDPYGRRYVYEKETLSFTGVFAGGGIRQVISGNTYLYLEILWDLNQSLWSPYSNPRIRIGVAAGL